MKPKISIIVPIYNVENYIPRCFESLLGQTLENIEIIAINDGSTDSSGKILSAYVARDSRVKVIEKNNGGVSSARNEGLKQVTGEYIGFVDPDDWVDPDMYENMYLSAIQENSDIVMCTYIREFGSHSKLKNFNLPEKIVYKNNELKSKVVRRLVGPLNEELTNPEMLDAWGTVWSKLYRSNLVLDNNLSFIDLSVIGTNEDSLFNMEAFFYANSFVFINKPYYHYWRENNLSVTTNYKPNLVNQFINQYEKIERFINKNELGENFYAALNNRICVNTLGLGLNTISKNNKTSSIRKIKIIKKILNQNIIKRSFISLDMKQFPIIWRAFYYCAKFRFASVFYFLLVTIDILRRTVK
jgi:glycosyltransferase involved in cell wall biosynthesis